MSLNTRPTVERQVYWRTVNSSCAHLCHYCTPFSADVIVHYAKTVNTCWRCLTWNRFDATDTAAAAARNNAYRTDE